MLLRAEREAQEQEWRIEREAAHMVRAAAAARAMEEREHAQREKQAERAARAAEREALRARAEEEWRQLLREREAARAAKRMLWEAEEAERRAAREAAARERESQAQQAALQKAIEDAADDLLYGPDDPTLPPAPAPIDSFDAMLPPRIRRIIAAMRTQRKGTRAKVAIA